MQPSLAPATTIIPIEPDACAARCGIPAWTPVGMSGRAFRWSAARLRRGPVDRCVAVGSCIGDQPGVVLHGWIEARSSNGMGSVTRTVGFDGDTSYPDADAALDAALSALTAD